MKWSTATILLLAFLAGCGSAENKPSNEPTKTTPAQTPDKKQPRQGS